MTPSSVFPRYFYVFTFLSSLLVVKLLRSESFAFDIVGPRLILCLWCDIKPTPFKLYFFQPTIRHCFLLTDDYPIVLQISYLLTVHVFRR